jgi:hypothetical protein
MMQAYSALDFMHNIVILSLSKDDGWLEAHPTTGLGGFNSSCVTYFG